MSLTVYFLVSFMGRYMYMYQKIMYMHAHVCN